MRRFWVAVGVVTGALLALTVGSAQEGAPWHWDLAYSGGGFWSVRVPVTVRNDGDADISGTSVQLVVGSGPGDLQLVGEPAASIRAVDSKGREVKCAVFSATGERKTSGALIAGDVVLVPVEAPAHGAGTVYVYAGNPLAWAPPEPFGGRFVNGSFEQGSGDTPLGWRPGSTTARHRMYWQKGGARTGEYCARCEVDEGAENQWVQYTQGGIPVVPGEKYRFTGWVKASNVKGRAGWYVHVDGVKPLMVNIVEGYEGTFDWRQVTIELSVPEGGSSFTCGTVLWGT
ncbi:MAG: hypothetical protein H5T86_16575, partial [Armatimonadetes bacterium]|nr:hypothetical protein [Armatimonadota bacterium]